MTWQTQYEMAETDQRRSVFVSDNKRSLGEWETGKSPVLSGGLDVPTFAIALNEPRAAIDVWYRIGSLTAVVSRPMVDFLSTLYSFRDDSAVRIFLEKHPAVLPILIEAVVGIRSVFSDCQLALEQFVDPEEDDIHLTLYVVTSMGVHEATKAWDELLDTWWLSRVDSVFGLLSLNIEFTNEF